MNSGKGNLHPTKYFISVIILYAAINQLNAQWIWNESALNKNFYSGVAMSCADVNGDAIDDLLLLDQSKHLWLGLNNGSAYFYWTALPYHQTTRVWSINVADIDNNGYNDILLSGESTFLIVIYQDQNGFHSSIADDANFFTQAACSFDYNQDGWLDFAITDDNDASRMYKNNGAGKLERDTVSINLNLADKSKNGGNYGCILTDYDWDGDADLYISKCKPGVDDPTDPQRINLLYVQNDTGWTEEGTAANLNNSDQSWISVFEDFDGDGLPDVFILNHYTPSRLLKQKPDHTFEDYTSASGLDYAGIGIQVMAHDFDNDADLDLLISGTSVELWLNDGKMHFDKTELSLSENPFSSCAAGDFNADGFLDLYTSYASLLNSPSNQKDKLWLNPGNQNHYITFAFKGTASNKNGVGTKIKVFADGKLQIRELHAGESYGIQNSLNLHVGLGGSTIIDSVIVYWPSGVIDKYYQLDADQKYLLNESSCLYSFSNSLAAKAFRFCVDVDTFFLADPAHTSVVWNDGTVGSKVNVKSEGVYYYTALDAQSCFIISNPNSVIINPETNPRLNINYSKILCEGEKVELQIGDFDLVKWSNGDQSKTLEVSQTGIFYGSVDGFCKTEYSDTLIVYSYDAPDIPEVISDTLHGYKPAILKGNVDSIHWYETVDATDPIYSGKIFETDSIFNSRSYWAEAFESHTYNHVRGGLVTPVYESSPYHADFINNQMLFNVYKDLILDSVTVYTNDPGERQIELYDAKGVLLNKTLVSLNKGKSQIYLGYHVTSTRRPYVLTTNENKNIESFGTKSPKLYRSDKDFFYPFFIEDKLRILTSDKGDSYFYYFYDWVIRGEDEICDSERIEVPVVLIPVSTDDDEPVVEKYVELSNGNQLRITGFENENYHIEIIDVVGKLIQRYKNVNSGYTLRISPLYPGIYFCRLVDAKTNQLYSFRIVVN